MDDRRERLFDSLAAELEGRADQLVDALVERARERAPEWTVGRPELERAQREITRESILAELRIFRRDARAPDLCPPADIEYARQAVQVGAPLELVVLPYRDGHAVQWQAWSDLVESRDLEPSTRRWLLQRGSDFFFSYADRLAAFVSSEYLREREGTLRSREQRRTRIVTEILAGGDVPTEELGYDVNGSHIGAIVRGPDPAAVLRSLAVALDRRLLLVSVIDQTWAWLGGAGPLGRAGLEALGSFSPQEGTTLALGNEERGREGFRRTHRQAGQAHRAGRVLESSVTLYSDIALEALAGTDEPEARAFVTRELAGIDDDTARSRALRQTLEAYFAAGQNAARTAATLGVHEQTVAQRLRAVEERTSRPVPTRRVELETALRLRRYLGPVRPRPDSAA